jgi:hypothetical protein
MGPIGVMLCGSGVICDESFTGVLDRTAILGKTPLYVYATSDGRLHAIGFRCTITTLDTDNISKIGRKWMRKLCLSLLNEHE